MQFHAIQHDVISQDFNSTRTSIENQIASAQPSRGDFVVLQEMTDTGWSMQLDKIAGIGTVEWACTVANKFGIWLQVGWADCVEGEVKTAPPSAHQAASPLRRIQKSILVTR